MKSKKSIKNGKKTALRKISNTKNKNFVMKIKKVLNKEVVYEDITNIPYDILILVSKKIVREKLVERSFHKTFLLCL